MEFEPEAYDLATSVCRRVFEACPTVQDTRFRNVHPTMLRTILDAIHASAADSVRHFKWIADDWYQAAPPLDFSPKDLVRRLSEFPRLEPLTLLLTDTIAAKSKRHGPRLATLSLRSLNIATRAGEHDDEIDTLLKAVDGTDLQHLAIRRPYLTFEFDLLSRTGGRLTSLFLIYGGEMEELLPFVVGVLPLHPNLLDLYIMAGDPDEPASLTPELTDDFLSALPPLYVV